MDQIYTMRLSDILHTSDYEVIRVPGGWVYTRFSENGSGGYSASSCFVPLDSEFMTFDDPAEE